jgi:NAD(P)H-hydrate epimerase
MSSHTYLTRQQVRRVDAVAIEQFGFSGLMLMENAGGGAARRLISIAPNGRFVILCGKGNNGGDGFVIARHLEILGRSAQVLATDSIESMSADCKTNALIYQRSGGVVRFLDASSEDWKLQAIDFPVVATETVIVDCLLGTGAQGELREPYRSIVQWSNAQHCLRIAIDIPTGMDCDTGEIESVAFRADQTLTFVALKSGFANPKSFAFTGPTEVIGIGIGQSVLKAVC